MNLRSPSNGIVSSRGAAPRSRPASTPPRCGRLAAAPSRSDPRRRPAASLQSTPARSSSGMLARPLRASRSRAGVQTATTRISLRVSVPVLSVQMTVVLPSVSTAGNRRTTARRRGHPLHTHRERDRHDRRQSLGDRGDGERHAPRASASSDAVAARERDRHERRRDHADRRREPAGERRRAAGSAASARPSSAAAARRSSRARSAARWRPRPPCRRRSSPACRRGPCRCGRRPRRRPRPAPALLGTGSDSPVSGDSSISSDRATSTARRPARARRPPAPRDRRAPRRPRARVRRRPSRTTVASSGIIAPSASIARPARHSWRKPISVFATTPAIRPRRRRDRRVRSRPRRTRAVRR